jgi:uncharacterized membrane protein YczE
MLPLPPRHELKQRLPRLVWGLFLFGFGIALMVAADLGLGPWDVFHQGVSAHTPIPIGSVVIITGVFLLVLWIPLRERIGIGTLLNALLIGAVMDLSLIWLETPTATTVRWVYLVGGVVIVGIGSGYYIGAGLGPGPRDGLMTGLAKRGWPIGLARLGIELAALLGGWLLGGTIGAGTVLFALGIGPLVHVLLPRLTVKPVLSPES